MITKLSNSIYDVTVSDKGSDDISHFHMFFDHESMDEKFREISAADN